MTLWNNRRLDFGFRASGLRCLLVFVAAVSTLCCHTLAAQGNPIDPTQTNTFASQIIAPASAELQDDLREPLQGSVRQFEQQTLDALRQSRLLRDDKTKGILYAGLGIMSGIGLLAILLVSVTQTRSLNRLAGQVTKQLNRQTDTRLNELAQLKQDFRLKMSEFSQFEDQTGALREDNQRLQHNLSCLQQTKEDLTADHQRQAARLAAVENDLTEKTTYIRQLEQCNQDLANTNETLTAQLNRQQGAKETALEALTQCLRSARPLSSRPQTTGHQKSEIPESKRALFESIHSRLQELEQKLNSLSPIEEHDTGVERTK